MLKAERAEHAFTQLTFVGRSGGGLDHQADNDAVRVEYSYLDPGAKFRPVPA